MHTEFGKNSWGMHILITEKIQVWDSNISIQSRIKIFEKESQSNGMTIKVILELYYMPLSLFPTKYIILSFVN